MTNALSFFVLVLLSGMARPLSLLTCLGHDAVVLVSSNGEFLLQSPCRGKGEDSHSVQQQFLVSHL